MARPFPVWPRGARRKKQITRHLLGCPRLCRGGKLDALRALTKPQFKQAILHRPATQVWPKEAKRIVVEVKEQIAERLGISPQIHLPNDGDYFLFADFAPAEFDAAKAPGGDVIESIPRPVVCIGWLLIRDGRFYRRDRRVRFTLARATSVHVSRPMRTALRGVI